MDKVKELEQLITSSYLHERQKRELFLFLQQDGATEEFFQKFNESLMEELSNREQQFTKSIATFEEEEAAISRDVQRKRKELEDEAGRSLATIDLGDFAKRQQVWDEYYTSLEQLENEYGEKIKSIVAMIVKTAMK